jgi:heat shock protein HslJ
VQPNRLFRSLIRVAVLVTLAAGTSAVSASAADASLAGTHWRLVSVGSVAADLSRREPFILLDADGRLSGGTGCNRFAGGYVVDGGYLSFGQVATTRMYCAGVWEQERAILAALPQVTRWQVSGDRLELAGDSGRVSPSSRRRRTGAESSRPRQAGGDASSVSRRS